MTTDTNKTMNQIELTDALPCIGQIDKTSTQFTFTEMLPGIVEKMDIDTTRFIETVFAHRANAGLSTHNWSLTIPGTSDVLIESTYSWIEQNLAGKVDYEHRSPICYRAICINHETDNKAPDLVLFITKYMDTSNLTVNVIGDGAGVNMVGDYFKTAYDVPDVKLLHCLTGFSDNGPIITTTKITKDKSRIANDTFYPFITKSCVGDDHVRVEVPMTISEIVDSIINNTSNLTLFYGTWGTGKTTLMRTIMSLTEWTTFGICNSAIALSNPSIVSWISSFGNDTIIGLEDADLFISSRKQGNALMSSFLNELDGVAESNRKVIVSTNLSDLSTVDEALLRPGRCANIYRFTKLTLEQANKVRESLDQDPIELDDVNTMLTLSEAINFEDMHVSKFIKQSSFGVAAS